MKNEKSNSQIQSYRKLWNYFLAIESSDKFHAALVGLRKKFQIPKEGYSWTKAEITVEKRRKLLVDHSRPLFLIRQCGDVLLPPEKWVSDYKKRDIESTLSELQKDIDELCKEYGFSGYQWRDMFELKLFYNKTEQLNYNEYEPSGLCFTHHLLEDSDIEEINESPDTAAFPVMICLSPYASKRDILDYVTKTYELVIAPMQTLYKRDAVKIGKFRSRNEEIRRRDEFIYHHGHQNYKDIKTNFREQFGKPLDLGYSEIAKIVSLETKRRKEV